MFWLQLYLLIGFIIPFIFLWYDGKDKQKGEELGINLPDFLLVVVMSVLLWWIIWPAVGFGELQKKTDKIKKFW